MAVDVAPASEPIASTGLQFNQTDVLIITALLFTLAILAAAYALLNASKAIYGEYLKPTPFQKPVNEVALSYVDWKIERKKGPSLLEKLLGLQPLEKEKDLIIDHSYDGIQELDNPIPVWFNILFSATLIIAVCYLFYYQVSDAGGNQDKEYEHEMVVANKERALYLEKSANAIDENSVKFDNTPNVLAEGKTIFATNCVVCHGDHGQGTVGPNLTDSYWLHGGGIHNIFKTIKYGVPEKGMISWEKQLTPKQISAVANFILSLKDTNPAGAKAPQGEKYEEKDPQDNAMKEADAKKPGEK